MKKATLLAITVALSSALMTSAQADYRTYELEKRIQQLEAQQKKMKSAAEDRVRAAERQQLIDSYIQQSNQAIRDACMDVNSILTGREC